MQLVRLIDPQLADTMAEAVLAWTLYRHRDMARYRLTASAIVAAKLGHYRATGALPAVVDKQRRE